MFQVGAIFCSAWNWKVPPFRGWDSWWSPEEQAHMRKTRGTWDPKHLHITSKGVSHGKGDANPNRDRFGPKSNRKITNNVSHLGFVRTAWKSQCTVPPPPPPPALVWAIPRPKKICPSSLLAHATASYCHVRPRFA